MASIDDKGREAGMEANAAGAAAAGLIAAAFRAAVADGTIPAIAREAIKDVRSTLHNVLYGQPEGPTEPGTPLSPTQGEIAAARQNAHPYGPDRPAATPSAGDIAHDRDVQGTGGQVLSQDQKGWADRIRQEREKEAEGGNDQNERAKGRSLPDEQQEQAKERERGGRGR